MEVQKVTVNSVEANYKNAVVNAYNAASLRAEDSPQKPIGHPVDHAAQAALENSALAGTRFETAYDEVWQTIYHLSGACDSTDEMSEQLDRIKNEILRATYDN